MLKRNDLPENSSEQVDGLPGAPSASTMTSDRSSSHSSISYPLLRQGIVEAANNVRINPISYAAQPAILGTNIPSHTPYVPPYPSASQHSTISLASSPFNLILERITSSTHSALPSTSLVGLTSSLSTSTPSEASVPDETDCSSEDERLRGGDGALRTPATSDTSTDADDIFTPDEDDDDQAALIQERDAFLVGLDLPEDFRRNPLFRDSYENDGPDLPSEILNEILDNDHTKFQARQDARPWGLGAEEFLLPLCGETLHGPDPGPAYNKYYSSTNGHSWENTTIQRKRKGSVVTCKPKRRSLGTFSDVPYIGTPQSPQDIVLSVPQCSEDWIEVRGRGSSRGHNGGVTCIGDTFQRPTVYRLLNGISFSVEEFVLNFHPAFLVSQLSEASVLTLTTEVQGPHGLVHNRDYAVRISLGFGPPIPLDVCTFVNNNRELLRSYQKRQGQDQLDIKYSLPIALDLFSMKTLADDINTWLERRIDSVSDVLEFAALMRRRHKRDNPGDQSVRILIPILSWFFEHSRPSDQVFRTALKLLMTTTLLNVVPRVTNLPDSLLRHLSSQISSHSSPPPSFDAAPRLLNRQIKTSVYHLQQEFLSSLFRHFDSSVRLSANLEATVALLVAFVLELVGNAGRLYARHSATINPSAPVDQEDITRYESRYQKRVFDKVKAGISGIKSRGRLGEELRVLNWARKGKERETQDFQFVDEILDNLV